MYTQFSFPLWEILGSLGTLFNNKLKEWTIHISQFKNIEKHAEISEGNLMWEMGKLSKVHMPVDKFLLR